MGRVVITGGKGELGKALNEAFAQSCTWSQVEAPGRDELDVSQESSVRQWFSSRDDVEVLVANAGISRDGLLANLTLPDLEATLSVNLKGVFWCVQAALAQMQPRRCGHILLIGSRVARVGGHGQTAYSATKAALHGLATSIAREYGPENIRCNVVLPGFLETRMTSQITERRRAQIRADLTLGRFNTPANAARFIAFLAGLDHVSGQVFTLDSRIDRWC